MFTLAKSNSLRVMGVLGLIMASTVQATVVEVRTALGNVQINLFDEETPETVENFLDYVNSGAYANTVIHRLEPGFVAQSGGFVYNGMFPLDSVPTGTPVINEPTLSNVRGTIAMAKLASSPDSATSQWFINLSDNSANLDVQNGGFTVFGQVLGNGMEVLDAIEDLPRFNLGGAADSIPLQDYTNADANNDVEVTGDNLVIITDVVVTDSATVTNPDIVPVENTLIDAATPDVPGSGNNSSGGGSLGFFLLSLALVCRWVKFKRS
jgi:peptidyl-prolyl cis-trans isomerase A (cyclophilin A)|tara:strand:+ start:192 stop:989 length:798 start_codon:yes stop_codon:yes gene_type:complete